MDVHKTIAILDALSPVVSVIPVAGPVLGAMLQTAGKVSASAENAKVNCAAYQQLAQEIAGYAAAVSQAAQSDPRFSSATPSSGGDLKNQQDAWIEQVRELTSVFSQVEETINRRQAQDDHRRSKLLGGVRRFRYDMFHAEDDQDQVDQLRKKIERGITSFNLGIGIREIATLESMVNEMKATAVSLEQVRQETKKTAMGVQQVEYSQQLALMNQQLKPVPGSRFGEEGMPNGCLANTRVKILEQLHSWAIDKSESSPTVFGLTGLAGTGKTTVSISFCEDFDPTLPVVTFFISRSDAERQSAVNVIRTLSYQLGVREGAARAAITETLQNGRDITARSLTEQVKGLFVAPLRSWEGSELPVLVVIDALDECDKVDGVEGGRLIPLIIAAIRQFSGRVKLLITSREEPEIMKMFRAMGVNKPESSIRLQNIEDAVVKQDIIIYYQYHFALVIERLGSKHAGSWPSQRDFDLLVERTGKLFVYAALVARLLKNPRVDPKKQLEEILRPSAPSANLSALRSLDNLYLVILEKAANAGDEALNETVQRRVHQLVGALVLLQAPLNARTLSALLGEDVSLIQGDIDHLSAVLIIPDDAKAPTTIFHPSFADYVLGRCRDPRFRIDPAVFHAQLLRCTLTTMERYLKRDMCSIGDPSAMNADIEDLEAKREHHLPPELRYACEYWLVHLTNAGDLDNDLAEKLNTFCDRHLLHWIEALSLLDKVSVAHLSLPGAIDRCRRRQDPGSLTTTSLLGDAERVVETYDSLIRSCALQVYCSVLLFMPECKLDDYMKHEQMGTVELKTRRLGNWSSLRRTLEEHARPVKSVAFSADGTRIASGSDDKTVRVWDAITGAGLGKFEGHAEAVVSVAFSPDGMRIASGSYDNTVRVWDAIIGAELAKLDGHTKKVTSVAFSVNGKRIASGSSDQTVWVWDTVTGGALIKLEGHTREVTSVAFSADGTRIASGSEDKTVRVWNTTTGEALAKLDHSREVTSVAFSPDGTQIASSSKDRTVWVWDPIAGDVVTKLDGRTHTVMSVAFSADGAYIVSGSNDRIVRVWDAITGTTLTTLKGHNGQVNSIAFSPDGTRIASGSSDRTVRVWDATTSDALAKLDGHTTGVVAIAFSADGTRIVSGSNDQNMLVWDATTGRALFKLSGHTREVTSVAFSPDGTRIVSGSSDETVQLWDAVTGDRLAKLDGHTNVVEFVAFSKDGTYVLSKDFQGIQKVWHADEHFLVDDYNQHTAPSELHADSPASALRFNRSSGWLEAAEDAGRKRLCWIPPERRGTFWSSGHLAVFSTSEGGITILSISHF